MNLDEAYARIGDKLTREEFSAKVEEQRAAFDGLLDDEALALLVLDEMGANAGAYLTIAELEGRQEATVRVVIDRIEQPREFQRDGRAPGRLAGCGVSDATGKARLVLWDRDVDKTEDGTLTPGARVTVVNARVKESRWGLELHVSPWTVLEVEGALDPAKRKLLMDVADSGAPAGAAVSAPSASSAAPAREERIVGKLAHIHPTTTYKGDDGKVGFRAEIDIDTEVGSTRIVLEGEPVRSIRQFLPGARIRVTGLVERPKGAGVEWWATAGTRVERA